MKWFDLELRVAEISATLLSLVALRFKLSLATAIHSVAHLTSASIKMTIFYVAGGSASALLLVSM